MRLLEISWFLSEFLNLFDIFGDLSLELFCRSEFILQSHFLILFLAPLETECVKKSYTKILDAYGCLGVLNLTHGKFAEVYSQFINSCVF